MAAESLFETLPNEVFENIVSRIEELRHLSAVSKASRVLYHRIVPRLYHSWSYHGHKHSVGSIRSFLMTILWRPDLAAHVKTLDLREWGSEWGPCPRLEDCVEGKSEQEPAEDAPVPEPEEESWGDTDNEDNDYHEESEDGDDTSSNYSDDPSEPESDDLDCGKPCKCRRPWHPDDREGINRLLRKAAKNMDLEDPEFLVNVHTAKVETRDDLLLPVLVSHLTNLRTLYLVAPEDDKFWAGDGLSGLFKVVELASEDENIKILQKLETLYICSALHIGPKGHREYELSLDVMLPFMKLPNLRSVYTLTADRYNDASHFGPIDYQPLRGISSVTSQSFDESRLELNDTLQAIGISKALKSFRWSQEFRCENCHAKSTGPFHNLIGEALRAHKSTLERIDLDIRHRYCNKIEHRGNPYSTTESIRAYYRRHRYGISDPESITRGPSENILVGNLKDFMILRELSIDATALCGHQKWVAAPVPMIEVLPPSLHTLNLRVRVQRIGECSPNEQPGTVELDNIFWPAHLLDLIRRAHSQLPELRKIGILVLNHAWNWTRNNRLPIHRNEYGRYFREIEDACTNASIEFSMVEEHKETTYVPYFLEQNKVRRPG